jgi:hypothetical protein
MTKEEKEIIDEIGQLKILQQKQKESKFKNVAFDDIDWKAVYDEIVHTYINPLKINEHDDEEDPHYLYEYMLLTICPNIFK